MPTTHLRITITPHRPNSLPGYDGDRRVEWSISEDAVSTSEAQRKTRDALRVLRAFWEEAAPEGLRFEEFAKTVLSDGALAGAAGQTPTNGQHAAGANAGNVGNGQNGAAASEGLSSVAGNGAGAAGSTGEGSSSEAGNGKGGAAEEDTRGQAERELDLVDPLAERLVRHPTVLPAFLSDLRDWDSFRLLLRRHGGEVPFRQIQHLHQQQQLAQLLANNAAAAGEGSPVSPASPTVDRSSYILTALAGRERLWQDERASLHAALWAAGEQVRALVSALTEALDRVATVTINQPNQTPTTSSAETALAATTQPPPISITPNILNAIQTAQSLPTNSSPTSPTNPKKNVTFSDTVLRREVLKESQFHQTAMWHAAHPDGSEPMPELGMEWREQGWLRELAEKEDQVQEGLAQVMEEEEEEEEVEKDVEEDVDDLSGKGASEIAGNGSDSQGGSVADGGSNEPGPASGTKRIRVKAPKKAPVSILKTETSTTSTITEVVVPATIATPSAPTQPIVIQPPSAPTPPNIVLPAPRDKNDPGERSGRSAVDGERPELNGDVDTSGAVLIASGRRKRRNEEPAHEVLNVGVDSEKTGAEEGGSDGADVVNGIKPILLASGRRRNGATGGGNEGSEGNLLNGIKIDTTPVFVDGDERISPLEDEEESPTTPKVNGFLSHKPSVILNQNRDNTIHDTQTGPRESISSSVAVVGITPTTTTPDTTPSSSPFRPHDLPQTPSPTITPTASPSLRTTPVSTPSPGSTVTLVDVPVLSIPFGRNTLSRVGSKSKLRPSEKEKEKESKEKEREQREQRERENKDTNGAGVFSEKSVGVEGVNGAPGGPGVFKRVWRKVSKEILKTTTANGVGEGVKGR